MLISCDINRYIFLLFKTVSRCILPSYRLSACSCSWWWDKSSIKTVVWFTLLSMTEINVFNLLFIDAFSLSLFTLAICEARWSETKKDDQSTSHWFTMDLLSLCIHDGCIPMCTKCVLILLIFFYSHSHQIVFTIFCLIYSCVFVSKRLSVFHVGFF